MVQFPQFEQSEFCLQARAGQSFFASKAERSRDAAPDRAIKTRVTAAATTKLRMLNTGLGMVRGGSMKEA